MRLKSLIVIFMMFLSNTGKAIEVWGLGYAHIQNVGDGSNICGATDEEIESTKQLAEERASEDARNQCPLTNIERISEWSYYEDCFYHYGVDYKVRALAIFNCFIRP